MDTTGLIIVISFGTLLILIGVFLLLSPERIIEWRSRSVEMIELTKKGIIKGALALICSGLALIALTLLIIFILLPMEARKALEVEAQKEQALEEELGRSFEKIKDELESEE